MKDCHPADEEKKKMSYKDVISAFLTQYLRKIFLPLLDHLFQNKIKHYKIFFLHMFRKKAKFKKNLDYTEQVIIKPKKTRFFLNLRKISAFIFLKKLFDTYLKRSPIGFDKDKKDFLLPRNLFSIIEKIYKKYKVKRFEIFELEKNYLEILNIKQTSKNVDTNKLSMNKASVDNIPSKALKYLSKKGISAFSQYDEYNYKGYNIDK